VALILPAFRGYSLWDGLLGGITPCFSSSSALSTYIASPPVTHLSTGSASASPSVVTSTVLNVVYARYYPVSGAQTGLDTAAQAGIGVGAGMGALAGVGLASWLWVRRRRRRVRSMYPTGGASLLQSNSGSIP
jgi:hypothetical protein